MATRPVTPFGGYLLPRSTEEDTTLTGVSRLSPGGEYLRRFWHPIAMAEELKDMPMPIITRVTARKAS